MMSFPFMMPSRVTSHKDTGLSLGVSASSHVAKTVGINAAPTIIKAEKHIMTDLKKYIFSYFTFPRFTKKITNYFAFIAMSEVIVFAPCDHTPKYPESFTTAVPAYMILLSLLRTTI